MVPVTRYGGGGTWVLGTGEERSVQADCSANDFNSAGGSIDGTAAGIVIWMQIYLPEAPRVPTLRGRGRATTSVSGVRGVSGRSRSELGVRASHTKSNSSHRFVPQRRWRSIGDVPQARFCGRGRAGLNRFRRIHSVTGGAVRPP